MRLELDGEQPDTQHRADIIEGLLIRLVSLVLELAAEGPSSFALREARLIVEELASFRGVSYPADVRRAAAGAQIYLKYHLWNTTRLVEIAERGVAHASDGP
jgi:hypothetical protein